MLENIYNISGLVQETTTTTTGETSFLSEFGWVLLTIGAIALFVAFGLYSRRKSSNDPEDQTEAMDQVQEQYADLKTKSKEVKAIRRDVIKAGLFLGVIWNIFYPFFFLNMKNLGINHVPFTIFTVIVLCIVASVGAHGFTKTLGMSAVRGTEKSEHGGRSKQYNMLHGSHFPLIPGKIKKILSIYDSEIKDRPLYKMLNPIPNNANPETTPDITKDNEESEESELPRDIDYENNYVVNYQLDDEITQEIIPKDWVPFLDIMSAMKLEEVMTSINKMIERRSSSGSRAEGLIQYLKTYMEDDYKKSDIEHICKEMQKLEPITPGGVAFGGVHLEFCKVKQYDTDYVIWALPDSYEECFKFSDTDNIDSSYVPLPMPYTDIDWRNIGSITIQTAPEEFEIVNVLMPLTTDKDVRRISRTMAPHVLDSLAQYEATLFFVEPSAVRLLAMVHDLRTQLQQLKSSIKRNMKLALEEVKRFYMKLFKARFPGLRANLTEVLVVVLVAMIITGVIVNAVTKAGMT